MVAGNFLGPGVVDQPRGHLNGISSFWLEKLPSLLPKQHSANGLHSQQHLFFTCHLVIVEEGLFLWTHLLDTLEHGKIHQFVFSVNKNNF